MKIGFIGLGLMGRGMAANLRRAGHDMVVHDLRSEAAEPLLDNKVSWAATPKELAEACDLVFTSQPWPADVEAVLRGDSGPGAGFRGAPPGSTCPPARPSRRAR
jgi:3-hydroxyisobutyrate dehydrogenase